MFKRELLPLSKIFLISFFIITGWSCSNQNSQTESDKPLVKVYNYFEELNKDEFKLVDLEHKLNSARGSNDQAKVENYIKEFEKKQGEAIKKMEEKFPSGSVQIPFEQIHGKDSLIIKSVYVSGYSFPWNTATNVCFYFTVEYDLLKKDAWYIPISVKFVDGEDDVVDWVHLKANPDGKSRVLIRTQYTFRELKKTLINQ